jgi:hypothetical protein|tara:strand:- start:696 stop:848 length:153 start_codon:yes stop_codon:yes gene_type:complete
MAKTLEKVEQSDGSFRWEMVEFQPDLGKSTETKSVTKSSKKKTITTTTEN